MIVIIRTLKLNINMVNIEIIGILPVISIL